MSASAIYTGRIHHRRLRPVGHEFSYPVLYVLADLDELPGAFDRHPLWSARRGAPVRLRRRDHLYRPEVPLAEEARKLARAETGLALDGPVRLLTMPRMLGFGYNPVRFYFLHESGREMVAALMAEVTNTPWGERQHYVLEAGEDGRVAGRVAKRMHVSPFMAMEQAYEVRAGSPGDRLEIGIANHEGGERIFQAKLELHRRPLTRREMARAMLRHPPQAIATVARIYRNALSLRRKGLRLRPHPRSAGG